MTDQNPQLQDTTMFPATADSGEPTPVVLPDDGSGAMFAVAREHAEKNEVPAAIAAYRQLLTKFPTNVRARNNLALLLEKKGDADAALQELNTALETEPDNVSVLCNRAALLSGKLKYDAAEADLRRALRVDERNAEAWLSLGIVFCRRGRWREAVEPLSRAIELDPATTGAHYYLGEAYNHVDNLPAALAACEQASALAPNNWRAQKGIGIILDRMGRPAEASLAYQRARDTQRR